MIVAVDVQDRGVWLTCLMIRNAKNSKKMRSEVFSAITWTSLASEDLLSLRQNGEQLKMILSGNFDYIFSRLLLTPVFRVIKSIHHLHSAEVLELS